jgi:CheY-like chemotaxis protein
MKSKSFRILLVEDNRADAELISEILNERKLGTVEVVQDGERALAYLNRKRPYDSAPRPDLVLLDLNLPKLSGHEVLKAVKSDEKLRQIPILIFTSSDADRDVFRSYSLNANCYIQKPVDLDRFSVLVDRLDEFWLKTAKLPKAEGDIDEEQ